MRCYEELSTTICNGTRPGFTCGVIEKCTGFDVYNQATTGDKAKSLTAVKSDADHVPVVVYDARGNGDGKTVNTITGDHENRVTDYTSVVCERVAKQTAFCNWDGEQVAPTLTAHNAGGSQRMPDKNHFNCVLQVFWTCSHDDMLAVGKEQPIAIDRAFYNQGQNALYEPQTYEDGTCPTLVAKGPGADCTREKVRYIVRRLTPTECARLQGFPSIVEVDMKDITRDELCAIALAAGYIKVDTENGIVYGTRGPGGIERGTPIELHGSIVNGYKVYSIHAGGVKKQVRAHRLVWIAAHGAIPDGMVVDHINNDKSDNRLCNLQLLTHEQNSTKAREDGCYLVGDDHPGTKIGEKEKRALYFLYWNTDKPYSYYARMFGISDSRAQQIIHEKGWGHPDHKDDFTDEEYQFWLDVRNTHAEINGKAVKEYTKEQMLVWYNKLHTDSSEYKMWGNGIALPCVAYVMQGIEDALKGELDETK